MAGYWNAPAATDQVASDEWLDSGDLAHADEDGYLWFFGRKKQIIVHDGSNISPFEVEDALLSIRTSDSAESSVFMTPWRRKRTRVCHVARGRRAPNQR